MASLLELSIRLVHRAYQAIAYQGVCLYDICINISDKTYIHVTTKLRVTILYIICVARLPVKQVIQIIMENCVRNSS